MKSANRTLEQRRPLRIAAFRAAALTAAAAFLLAGCNALLNVGGGDGDQDVTGDVAWYSANSGSRSHSVAGKDANALGVHDMSGNVFEWTFDWAPGQEGVERMRRGGSLGRAASDLQIGFIFIDSPYFEFGDIGFRLARKAE